MSRFSELVPASRATAKICDGGEALAVTRAALYDAIYEPRDADISVYSRLALASTGAVLELGAGTGRLLAPLLTQGVDAWGLEVDPDMLEAGRARLQRVGGAPLAARLLQGDMRDFDMLGGKGSKSFALVIVACNTLSCLIEPPELAGALSCVHRHLSERGELAFDVSLVEGCSWFQKSHSWTGPTEAVWISGQPGTSAEMGQYDPGTRICELTRQFKLIDGSVAQTRTLSRQRSLEQLSAALDEAGLVPLTPAIDEHGRPASNESTRAFFRCGKR